MKKASILALLMVALLCASSASLGDWTPADANLDQYEVTYQEASSKLKVIRYGESGAKISAIKDSLATLGFFGFRISENYLRTLEIAVRVFNQQLRIGGDGQSISPLVQAMLQDPSNMPKAISPAIDTYAFSFEPDGANYTPYTFARLSRSDTRDGVKVGFSGVIAAVAKDGERFYCAVQMESDPAKTVYVAYQPLPRTTVYQVGDAVAVFGTTRGNQQPGYSGMQEPALFVEAERVGYALK